MPRYLLLLVLTVLLTSSAFQNDIDYKEITNGLRSLMRTGKAPPNFIPNAKQIDKRIFSLDHAPVKDVAFCELCVAAAEAIIVEVDLGLLTSEQIADGVVAACGLLNLFPERVCRGVVDRNVNIFLYIAENTPDITPDHFCGVLGQEHECTTAGNSEWTIDIAKGNSIDRPELNDPSEDGALTILHLSDIHYDPNYKPDGNANCNEPICCQQDQEDPTLVEDKCGWWTDYRSADAPWHLIEETVRHAKTTHSIDWIYYTGDIISHRVWDTSEELNTQAITEIFSYFQSNFDVPVYPVFGNHEPSPLNIYTAEGIADPIFDLQWLYQLAADLWTPWLGEEARETILKGGYYTVSPRKGFRVIALNGNVCYTFNWWLVYNSVDPFGQLQFLADTLKAAEDNNESVHILTHVPTGSGQCLKVWSREFNRIIERFAHTITGQFQGHTHKDEFHIHYNSSTQTQAISVAFNGASVTPFSHSNPSYRLYTVDEAAYTLLDSTEWTFNLTLANLKPSELPDWYQLYSFRETYGIDNLQPINIGKIPDKMAEDHSLLDLYFTNKYRNGDGIEGGCDDDCKKGELCNIVTSQAFQRTQCDYYTNLYDSPGSH